MITERISNLEKQANTSTTKSNPTSAFANTRPINSLSGSLSQIISPQILNDNQNSTEYMMKSSILKKPGEVEDRSSNFYGYYISLSKLDKENISLSQQYEEIKNKLETLYEQNKKTLEEYEKKIKNSKFSFDVLSRDLRIYYLEKLAKGIDVRYQKCF